MNLFQDPDYLQKEQYQDSSRLQARIDLHRTFGTGEEPWFTWVFDRLEISPRADFLELGCGPGDLWAENLPRIPAGWNVTLTDFSPGMLRAARDRLGSSSHRFQLAAADACRIPFPENQFDCLTANHMLYHVPDLPQALSEIRRVLRPGGRLLASTIGEHHMSDLAALVDEFQPGTSRRFSRAVNPFTLENGPPQLAPFFKDIKVLRRRDDLRITRSGPLVDYVLSSFRLEVREDRREDFRNFVRTQLESRGGTITIRKDTGLLTAVKKDPGSR